MFQKHQKNVRICCQESMFFAQTLSSPWEVQGGDAPKGLMGSVQGGGSRQNTLMGGITHRPPPPPPVPICEPEELQAYFCLLQLNLYIN